ncbi:hypothetical protein Agub_g98 [Astrephomene gubernaculifera]|uniref:Uncharacterized protein n=1 Tax=Astrephomene gubernaculifera TaxID=47775 RepID=A0AAD3DF76_9CHLO|nr:hypothetical protein Agub_g98 [Astrephomene gubernaculifera]
MATEVPLSGGAAGVRHYYAAVGNKEAKLATLLELLQTLQVVSRRPFAIICSARDTLDSVIFTLMRSRSFAVTAIHSDLTEKERELALTNFRRSAFETPAPAPNGASDATAASEKEGAPESEGAERGFAGGQEQQGAGEQPVCVLAITDVCLKALPKELLPLGLGVLVEFDLPPSKEVYTRRISTLFGGGRDRRSQRCVVVDMVEAGSIAAFRLLESFVAGQVQEVPVRVGDIFL